MKARQRRSRLITGLCGGLLAGASVASLGAQQTLQRGQTPGPRFMVPTFRSAEKNLGVQAAEAIRARMASDIPIRTLWVIPKTDITNTLEASGYSTTEALNPNDAKALANLLRADEYIEGGVVKDGPGFKVDANLLLVRGEGMVQPLPSIQAGKIDQAAKQLSDAVQAARKQIDHAKKCNDLARQKKFAEATAAARAGIAAYARSTMSRVCLADIYKDQKFGADSIIRISEEILAIHPQNRRALALVADAYNEKGNDEKYVQALTTLLAADPTNVRLQQVVVEQLARSGNASKAKPIIDDAVKQNPGDPNLIRLQFLIYLTLKEFKGAIPIGEEMVKTDTAMADTTFFLRIAGAYTADSQPQKAAEALARGVAKYPNNANLWLTYAQLLRTAGQTQQAVDAVRKALAIDPKLSRAWLQVAQTQVELNQPPDSVLASLRQAKAAGDSASLIAGYSLTLGNQEYRKANASKNPEEFRRAIKFLAFSDSTAASTNAKFLLGAANLSLGQVLLQEASEKKNCESARGAQAAFTEAQIYIPQGGAAFPDQAKQLMQGLATLQPFGERSVKALCK